MIRTNTPMTLNYLNDFYFLESLKAEINSLTMLDKTLEFKHSVMKLQEDIQKTCDEMYPNMALRIFTYLYAACLGEARHAAKSRTQDFYLTEIAGEHRSDIFKRATDFSPTKENISKIISVFDQKWGGSFGGTAWKNIAKALRMYFEVPNSTFIDHVVDLQHNSGTVFSKTETKYNIFFEIEYKGSFESFLNYKFSRNMLRSPYSTLYVTRKVRRLLDRFEVIFQADKILWACANLPQLDEYVIEWGNQELTITQKWLQWADCANGNTPNLRWLLYNQTRRINPYELHRKDFKKCVAKFEKEGKKKLSPFGKQYNTAWAIKVEEYYGKYKRNVKPDKQPVTYSKVPVKFKNTSDWEIEIQFLAKHFGYGLETDYGFKYTGGSHGIFGIGGDKVEGFDGKPGYLDGILTLEDGWVVLYIGGKKWNWEKKLEAILE